MSTEDRLVYWKRRARDAENENRWLQQDYAKLMKWMAQHFTEERRLRDRLTFVYGQARAHGATDEDLVGP